MELRGAHVARTSRRQLLTTLIRKYRCRPPNPDRHDKLSRSKPWSMDFFIFTSSRYQIVYGNLLRNGDRVNRPEFRQCIGRCQGGLRNDHTYLITYCSNCLPPLYSNRLSYYNIQCHRIFYMFYRFYQNRVFFSCRDQYFLTFTF